MMEDHEPEVMRQHAGASCLHTTLSRAFRMPVAVDPRQPHRPVSGPRVSCGHGSTGAFRHVEGSGMSSRDTLWVDSTTGFFLYVRTIRTIRRIQLKRAIARILRILRIGIVKWASLVCTRVCIA